MEALLELERVQRVLSLMSSRGLCSTGSSGGGDGGGGADRFLAQFLLFMVRCPPLPRPNAPRPPSPRTQPTRMCLLCALVLPV